MEPSRVYYDDAAHRAIRAKLGEGIKSQYELARPLPERLLLLLKELERHGDGKAGGDVDERGE